MREYTKRLSRTFATASATAILMTLLVAPTYVASASQPGQWFWGRTDISITKAVVWSRFEHPSKWHGSSARGDIDGLVRSACKAPGSRAYAESRYHIFGGSSTAYYRYC